MDGDVYGEHLGKRYLGMLLNAIRNYRGETDQWVLENGKVKPIYPDFNLAAKKAPELAPFFAALIAINENPDSLQQKHLDAMRLEHHEGRSEALDRLHSEGGAEFVGRLQKHCLITKPKEVAGNDEEYRQQIILLDNLALMPLKTVIAMIHEVNEEAMCTPSAIAEDRFKYYQRRKPQKSADPNPDDEDGDTSPGSSPEMGHTVYASLERQQQLEEILQQQKAEAARKDNAERTAQYLAEVRAAMERERQFQENELLLQRRLVAQLADDKIKQRKIMERERELSKERSRQTERSSQPQRDRRDDRGERDSGYGRGGR